LSRSVDLVELRAIETAGCVGTSNRPTLFMTQRDPGVIVITRAAHAHGNVLVCFELAAEASCTGQRNFLRSLSAVVTPVRL
jgi:hypothetical protein